MNADQDELVGRIRVALAGEGIDREVSMFGGRAFMVRGKMVVSAGKDGSLLARVDAVRHEELLERPGARQAEMGTGREMGQGWIAVDAAAIAEDAALAAWVEVALEYNRSVTAD